MTEAHIFRSYQPTDAEVLPDLFMSAIRSVYPDLEAGEWINDLYDIEHYYLKDGGDMIVGEVHGEDVAMGGIKRIGAGVGEMKRVAVTPELHGLGLGQELLTAVEERARELGLTMLVLDTTIGQAPAIRLYKSNGYNLVERSMVDHPSGRSFDTFFFEKRFN